MGKNKKKQQPKLKQTPISNLPRNRENPDSYLGLKPVWQFGCFDWDGPWGLEPLATRDWLKHIQVHLSNWETMTWQEILRQSGGKSDGNGTNHHPIEVAACSKKAQDRLEELKIYDDCLFSFRFDNCTRLYGIRELHCLKLLWFDPFHCERTGNAVWKWDKGGN